MTTNELLDLPVAASRKPDAPILHEGRSHFQKFGRNVLLKNIGEFSRLFQMAFFVIVARKFGAAALGNLTVLLMIGSGVGLLAGDLGINTAMIARMSGRSQFEQISEASDALSCKNILCFLSFFLMCIGMYYSRSSDSWIQIVAVGIISVGILWFEFVSSLTNGLNRFDVEVVFRLGYRGLVYGGGAFFALWGSLAGAITYMAGATVVSLAAAFFVVKYLLVPLHIRFRSRVMLDLLHSSVPVWITQLAQLTYLKFDVVILGLLHVAARETGWYAAAWKVADVLTSVPAVLSAAALPLLCGDSARTNIPLVTPRYLKIMYVVPFFFALPLAIGAGWITHIVYGDGFVGTPRILRILVWAVVPIFVHTFLATLAVATGRQSLAAKLATAISALGILFAVICVPRFGYEAMATVCLIANTIFAAVMVYAFRDATGSMQLEVAAKSIGSAACAYGLCWLLQGQIHPAVLAAAGTLGYFLGLTITGVVSLAHLRNARRFTNRLFSSRTVPDIGT
ncbi:MAG TPA: oligosaccharide flippase family protein [Candidatus Saccharimonadales bacterium]|nr:oligosaccharide flippase family protein [Candidatus Saccharimonadales bacterium]